jgi:hypothetical protein
MAACGESAPAQGQEVLQMMSGRAYAIRLALTVFLFTVVIPALGAGLLYAIEATRSPGDWGVVLGVFIIFLGIPAWLVAFAVVLWQVVHPRTRTIGLPFWMPPLVLILLAADWRIMGDWSYVHLFTPYLLGGVALLIALTFWPERTGDAPPRRFVNDCALWALAGFAVLACASFVGSLVETTMGPPMVVQIGGYARFAARWWVFVAIGAMVFAIVAGRRKIRRD